MNTYHKNREGFKFYVIELKIGDKIEYYDKRINKKSPHEAVHFTSLTWANKRLETERKRGLEAQILTYEAKLLSDNQEPAGE